jgi:MFS family permease
MREPNEIWDPSATSTAEHTPSRQSLQALDWLNFFKADAQTTVGPYLAIFLLAQRHWSLARIGIAMSIPGLVTLVAQTPCGALVDWAARKRALIIWAAVGLGAGCLLLVSADGLAEVALVQCVIGLASIVMPPAIAAVSVGLVGHRNFAPRMGRNEAYSHAGGVAAAITAGALAYWITNAAIFYFAAAMCAAAALSAMLIHDTDIDPVLAREAAPRTEGGVGGIVPVRELILDRRIAIFAVAVVLFHLANAAMLPLLGEMLSAGRPLMAAPYMSACIIISQLVMTPIAVASGRLADSWGRKPVFLIALAVLPIRGLLFASSHSFYLLIAVQILDGIGAGIFGVVAVIIVADLARGTGRFNLLQGAMNTCVAIGASLSNLAAGFVAQREGYRAGFLMLAAMALAGLCFFWAAMPETRSGEK